MKKENKGKKEERTIYNWLGMRMDVRMDVRMRAADGVAEVSEV